MTTISGDLRLVTNSPALVSQAWVRAVETRADGAGVIVDALAPVLVEQGRVEFECAPGVAVLLLAYAGGVPAKTIPLVVAGDSQSLGDAVRAGQGVDGAARSALDALRVEIAEALSGVTSGASAVAVDAADARASAESAQSSADAAQSSADAAAGSADAAAVSGRSASLSAEQAEDYAEYAQKSALAAAVSADDAEESAGAAAESAGQARGDAESAAVSAEAAQSSADAAASAAQDASIRAVADKVNELLEGAPEAYDTLLEIAEELERGQSAEAALVKEIAGKAPLGHRHTAEDVGAAPASHTHTVGDVTGLQSELDGKAPASHKHAIADTTGLQSALDGKASTETVDGVSSRVTTLENSAPIIVSSLPSSPLPGRIYLVTE